MIFFPIAALVFIVFILFLSALFVLGYFHIVTLGFENLGITPSATVFLFFSILIGSLINIPLGKKKLMYIEESRFFGLWKKPKIEAQGVAVNLGGAVIPTLLSFYFLFLILKSGFAIKPILVATILMIIVSKMLARIIPGKGITIPALIPPILSAIFALVLAPGFSASCAFISGTLGVLLGADILNLRRIQKYGGFVSIGGAGVFDGIFLVGIASALLAGI